MISAMPPAGDSRSDDQGNLKRKRMSIWPIFLALSICLVFITSGYRYRNGVTGIWAPEQLLAVSARSEPQNAVVHAVSNASTTASFTNQVRFDNYSLFIRDQRFFLHSGEFHTFRLPVPSLWPDILEKAKAAGLNAISVYTHMGLLNPSRGVVDLDGFRALQPLFDAAKEVGLFVVLRPGPYINAEVSAGGIAHWVTSEVAGELRSNATDYKESWQAYIKGVINATVPNQITKDGPVIGPFRAQIIIFQH
ncbi:hypothetical protein HGRIS_008369 [Hohenbuehelia grisea]|uniref:Glycoside hydrolase 35 catalytic domain-containing protein n=1 Tax=Hohenbuehelia grisea TaxID=104357 RepID=A0ABR3J7R1_9AGAR